MPDGTSVARAGQRNAAGTAGLRVHGVAVSYFTGKLESYLRYKEIPYERVPALPRRLRAKTGASQVPAVELADGRWLTDTTPIIQWFEQEHPEPAVIPRDPRVAFVSRLIEDHADEWLWRPAMHYRWSYDADKLLLSRKIVDELLPRVPLPGPLKRFAIRQRQLRVFVTGDGVDASTRPHVERSYLRTLELLSEIFESRPFLLGDRPGLADFGMMGPMLRHFSHDPTPAAIMVERAPAVWEWVTRTWNARGSRLDGAAVAELPSGIEPLLGEVGATHLVQLAANASAWKRGERRFEATIQGAPYRRMPTSRYRVWCLEKLRAHYAALPPPAAAEIRELLERTGCWAPLWEPADLGSRHDPEGRAPFCAGLEVLTAKRPE